MFLVFAAGSLSLLLFPDSSQIEAVLGAVFFGGLSGLTLFYAIRLPKCNVSIDEQGIWPAHLPREGNLIYWSDIADCQHAKPFFKCMYLLDSNDQKLLTIHYQVERFAELTGEIRRRANFQVVKTPVELWGRQRKQGMIKFAIFNGSLSWGVFMLIIMAHSTKAFQQGFLSETSIKYCITWLVVGFVYGVVIWFSRESRYKKQVQGLTKYRPCTRPVSSTHL